MTSIKTKIDGINGIVKINITEDGGSQKDLELRWCQFNEDGDTGFMTSFSDKAFIVTEVAAEYFLKILLSSIINTLNIEDCTLSITNHLDEEIEGVQFLPPTFSGNEGDIKILVSRQDMLSKLYQMYEDMGELTSDFLDNLAEAGVLDDFLSLIQIKLDNNTFKIGDNTNG